MPLHIIILAAGLGKRMRSKLPKVLHKIADKPLLQHVIERARTLQPEQIHVVLGHGAQQIKQFFAAETQLNWVNQEQQLGTGHAVLQAMPDIPDQSRVLVLLGDTPLISSQHLQALLDNTAENQIGLLTAKPACAGDQGRIIRKPDNSIQAIVEARDASADQLEIDEVNTGIMCFPAELLKVYLPKLGNDNAQGEQYLTDVIAMAVSHQKSIFGMLNPCPIQTSGINDRQQLAQLERYYQQFQAKQLLEQGVTLRDPARFDLRGKLTVGQDVSFDINVILEGNITLGNNVTIGANVVLRNVTIADNTLIKENSVIEDSTVGADCEIGPFARIRPGAEFADRVKIGNFVEIKKSNIATGSKISHLSYVGDATVGERVNIGAGTIVCNYDGAYKHPTMIEDDVFIGSDCQLVAPVKIAAGATIGAGSTITKDAPAEQLTLTRSTQKTIRGWQRPRKEK